jgi:hypothetical protein
MATTACTSYYKTTIIGFLPANPSGGTVVTFSNPTPVYSNITGGTIYQCNAVALGGFNGLNN